MRYATTRWETRELERRKTFYPFFTSRAASSRKQEISRVKMAFLMAEKVSAGASSLNREVDLSDSQNAHVQEILWIYDGQHGRMVDFSR